MIRFEAIFRLKLRRHTIKLDLATGGADQLRIFAVAHCQTTIPARKTGAVWRGGAIWRDAVWQWLLYLYSLTSKCCAVFWLVASCLSSLDFWFLSIGPALATSSSRLASSHKSSKTASSTIVFVCGAQKLDEQKLNLNYLILAKIISRKNTNYAKNPSQTYPQSL